MLKRLITSALAAVIVFTTPAFAATPSDIKGHWAEKNIQAVIDLGVFSGAAQQHLLTKFEPNRVVTRAEFCATLNQLNGFTDEADVTFNDVKAGDWFAADIKRAVAAGYIQGDGSGNANPNANVTRAEAARMLNLIHKYPEGGGAAKKFSDYAKIPGWALADVDACVKKGVINGDANNNFRPGDGLTRAEIVTLLLNVIG